VLQGGVFSGLVAFAVVMVDLHVIDDAEWEKCMVDVNVLDDAEWEKCVALVY
jgi:hypothetical protein